MTQSYSKLKPRIAVIGGGVAGLATAFLLREFGREQDCTPEIHILEARDVPGGSTRTERTSGYICEWGPNGFLNNEPATLELVERLGLTSRLVGASDNASRRYIYHHGKLRDLPTNPRDFLASDILPFGAKFRIAAELFVPAKRNGEEETVYQFGRRRLGEAFAHYLLDPMVSGIFAGNAHELSLPAVFPKMVEMESQYGGLFRALIAKKREARRNGRQASGPAGANAKLTTFPSGMGELTETMAAKLTGTIETGAHVSGIEKVNGHFIVHANGRSLDADAVVLACPAFEAAKVVEHLDSNVSRSANEIDFAPVDVVCHAHASKDIDQPIDGFGVLIPRDEGYRMLGCLWSDAIFPGQAPRGTHLLRTMVGGAHDRSVTALSDMELEFMVHKEHRTLLGVKSDPIFHRVIRHTKGIAQYTLGHSTRVARTEKLEQQLPGLYFTGASYRGVSVNGCAKDAFRVASDFWRMWGEMP